MVRKIDAKKFDKNLLISKNEFQMIKLVSLKLIAATTKKEEGQQNQKLLAKIKN